MKTLARLRGVRLLFFFSLAWCLSLSVDLPAQTEPFYKGKTIRIVVGTAAGGLYDRWARLLARYMGKYIPGNPEIIVQNMPGAGQIIASNYVYNVAKPDGLTLLMSSNSLYLDQFVGRQEVKFDVRKFIWLGTPQKYFTVIYMRADAPYKSIRDIIKAKEPPKCGAPGTTSTGYMLSKLLEETLGAKFSFVLGYPGASEIDLAVERGEVLCRGHDIVNHFSGETYRSWHNKGFDRHLVQTPRRRDPRLAEAPTIWELMDEYKTPEINRRLAEVILGADEFGRPMMASPGILPDRVKILREAYAKAMRDSELIAEAKRGKMDMDPSSGEELQALVERVMDQPAEVIERVKKVLGQ